MAVRTILTLPKHEKTLRAKSMAVTRVGRRTAALIEDLRDTLATVDGVGLAAPQIGVHERVALVTVGWPDEEPEEESPEPALIQPDEPVEAPAPAEPEIEVIALINPVIVEQGELERGYDGCLSIPGLQGYTRRPTSLRVRALDEAGNEVEYHFTGFDARVAAHEIDHLDGILYFDRLDTLEDLFYLVEGEEGLDFVPYLSIHPELPPVPTSRAGLPTDGAARLAS